MDPKSSMRNAISLPSNFIVTVDGPAASGKTSLAEMLADRLGIKCFDSGLVYRALSWSAIEAGISLQKEAEILKVANDLKLEFLSKGTVLVNGVTVGPELESEKVSIGASQVAAFLSVREVLFELQRRQGKGQVVAVGRDMGTKVFPEAAVKIFLSADLQERAARRVAQREKIPVNLVDHSSAAFRDQLKALSERDERDKPRLDEHLKPDEKRVIIDGTLRGLSEVVEIAWSETKRIAISADGSGK